MEITVPVRKHIVRFLPGLVLTSLLLVATLGYSFGTIRTRNALHRPPVATDTIVVHKQQTSKKHKIKLYSNASHEVLFFSAQGEDGRIYQLFLFSPDGNLVKQVNIKNRQTTIVNRMNKGDYLFEVFSDDERIENGQIEVR